jgi:histidine triad (HIT) family protein
MEDKNCIFCKIVRGEIPSYKIYEDKDFLGFLDAFPSMKGQALVIPKKHITPWLFDVEDENYCKIMLAAKKVVRAVDKAMKPLKTGMIVEGLELAHVHIKIFPLSKIGFRDYPKKIEVSKEEMEEIAQKIRNSF